MKANQVFRAGLCVAALLAVAVLAGCSVFGSGRRDTFRGEGGAELTRAKSELLAGDHVGARQSLKKALENGPSAEAHYYLALLELQRGGEPDAALQEAVDSLKDHPSAEGFLVKGATLEGSDPEGAARSYRLGLERARRDGVTAALLRRNLGVLLAKQGQWDAAHEHFSVYIQGADPAGLRVSDQEHALWGLMLYRRGQKEDARAAWARIRDGRLRERVLNAGLLNRGLRGVATRAGS